jgi:hypothetical protein
MDANIIVYPQKWKWMIIHRSRKDIEGSMIKPQENATIDTVADALPETAYLWSHHLMPMALA